MKTEKEIIESKSPQDSRQKDFDLIVDKYKRLKSDEHERIWLDHHQRTRWAHYTNIVLALWLISSPFTLAYRSDAMVWSDIISGFVIAVFSILSLSPRNLWAPYLVSFTGLWLLFAPLVFWAPTVAAYSNDTLVGSLVIAFSFVIPGMPGLKTLPGHEIPPGWNYNPSSWIQRAPIIALAFVGFFISRYLAAYQLGHITTVWDPIFPNGTKNVLESEVSRAWPISDAGLGAISYILEALSGFIGDTRRWRSMPWMVILFGILVVPLGVTSIVLVILQPVAVGAWCTLCLVTAVAMLIMISPALDEVIATVQFLIQSRKEGNPFWRSFWKGGTLKTTSVDTHKDQKVSFSDFISSIGLSSIPWNMVISAFLGILLMVLPSVLQIQGRAADLDHIAGALVVTFSVIAIGEVSRSARFINELVVSFSS
ncbi:MAG: vitamin K epoxide reductase family protein [Acidobacteriota bacterium]